MAYWQEPITCPIPLEVNDLGGVIGKVGNDQANKVTVEFDSEEFREWRKDHFGKVGTGKSGYQPKMI